MLFLELWAASAIFGHKIIPNSNFHLHLLFLNFWYVTHSENVTGFFENYNQAMVTYFIVLYAKYYATALV